MWAFRVPEVLLLVGGEDGSVAGDEVRDVVQVVGVFLDDCAGHDADVELFGEGLVGF